MKTWLCLVIIVTTIAFFMYATYRNEVAEEVYQNSTISSKASELFDSQKKADDRSSKNSVERTILNIESSSSWAVAEVLFKLNDIENSRDWHSEALLSEQFLLNTIENIQQNKTAREVIFTPFQSKYFKENEKSILRALYTVKKSGREEIILIVRGHSLKSAKLLATILIKTYKSSLANEKMEDPLVPTFQKQAVTIRNLHQQIQNLKEQISSENNLEEGKVNIEALALQAEVIQLEKEFKLLRKTLQEIEKIHGEDESTDSYLKVSNLKDFGRTEDLANTINQLQGMLINKNLDPVVKKEVEKNIIISNDLLENEIALAIVDLKKECKKIIDRKVILSNRIIELQKKEVSEFGFNPKFKLLKKFESQLEEEEEIYIKLFADWKNCKFDAGIVE